MESWIRVLLLSVALASLSGCASVRNWFHHSPKQDTDQTADQNAPPPRVIEPEVARRTIKVPTIHSSDFELGADYGVMSIEDFGAHPTYGFTLAYHITEDFFFQGEWGRSRGGQTSFETLSGIQLLTESERRFTYYDLSLGYNFLPGEAFIGRGIAMTSAMYRLRRGYEVHGEFWCRLSDRAGGLAGTAHHRAGPRVPVEPAGHHQAHQQPRGAHRYDRLLLEGRP
jgi:hypothetical protein